MKTKLTIFFILSLAIFSCNYGENIEIEPYPKDSITFSINTRMNVTQQVNRMSRKSTLVDETMYENLNLYIFDESGNLIDYKYTSQNSDLNNIKLTIWKDKKYSIYGIANAGQNINVKTITELLNQFYEISSIQQISSENGGVIMTGQTPPTMLTDGISLDLILTRSVAKISFQVDLRNLSAETSIDIKKVSIKNIPNKINLFKDSKAVSINDILIDGNSLTDTELSKIKETGCSFYIYENMQGANLLPTNNAPKGKIFSSSDPRAKLCSYLEIESEYNSPSHTGSIKHRFYLGEDDLTNFNIIRNKHYTHTLSFKGSGIDEVSWRVDIDELKEYITDLSLTPPEYTFYKLEETKQISASILPYTAHNKVLEWSSSHPSVATVDQLGNVKSISDGSSTITATTTDGTNITATSNITAINPQITISGQSTMFYGESIKATISALTPSNTAVIWSSSNESVLTIDQSGNIQTVGIGNATVRGEIISNKYSEYKVTVLPLTLTLITAPSKLHKGFKDTIDYSITPTHAEKLHKEGKLPITWTSENKNIKNVQNIYWGERIGTDKIIGYFTDHRNIRVSTNTTTHAAFGIKTDYHSKKEVNPPYIRILNNAKFSQKHNMKYEDISIYHPISTTVHPNANITWSSNNNSIKINSNNQIYCEDGTFFATNGKHNLTGSIKDDFNVIHTITIHLRIYEEVNITIKYERHGGGGINNNGLTLSLTPSNNKNAGNIKFHDYDGCTRWEIVKNRGWNTYYKQYSQSNPEVQPEENTNVSIIYDIDTEIIEDTYSPDKFFRYYISLL